MEPWARWEVDSTVLVSENTLATTELKSSTETEGTFTSSLIVPSSSSTFAFAQRLDFNNFPSPAIIFKVSFCIKQSQHNVLLRDNLCIAQRVWLNRRLKVPKADEPDIKCAKMSFGILSANLPVSSLLGTILRRQNELRKSRPDNFLRTSRRTAPCFSLHRIRPFGFVCDPFAT